MNVVWNGFSVCKLNLVPEQIIGNLSNEDDDDNDNDNNNNAKETIVFMSKTSSARASCFLVQLNLDYLDSLGPDEIVLIIEGPDNRKYEWRTKLIKLRKRYLIVKQHFYKLFGGPEVGVPDVHC